MFFNLHVENNQIIKLPGKTTPTRDFLSNQGRLLTGPPSSWSLEFSVGHWSVDTTAAADNNF